MNRQTYWLAIDGDGTIYKYDQEPECLPALGGWFSREGSRPGERIGKTGSYGWEKSLTKVV